MKFKRPHDGAASVLDGADAARSPVRIGYARVSTEDQKTNAQIDALKAAGCELIYQETRSGGTMDRPELQTMLRTLQPGDTVVVYKMDRIARSLRDLMDITEIIHQAKAEFKSLTEIIDTTTPSGRFIFQIFGAFAEFERELIRERTRMGLRAARERGRIGGQPRKMSPSLEAEIMELWISGRHTKSELAARAGVNISSIKRAITRNGIQQKRPDDKKLEAKIKRTWLSGKYTVDQVAKRVGVSAHRVRLVVNNSGIPVSRRSLVAANAQRNAQRAAK
jgi:DNA invertase Pin-like site-specific DNA recombinase